MSKTDQQILHLENLVEEIKNLQKTFDSKNFALASLQGEKAHILSEWETAEKERIESALLSQVNQKYLSEMSRKQSSLVSESVSKIVQEVSNYLDSQSFKEFLKQVVSKYQESHVNIEFSEDMQDTLWGFEHIQKLVVPGSGIFRINFATKTLNFDKQNMLLEIADAMLASKSS